jgi:glycine cleavage system H protein
MAESIIVGKNLIRRGLLYTRTHEWIDPAESPSRIGISDYAQRSLHDVVYVELPKIGALVKKGSTLCTLESIKAVAEAYSPIDGTIIAINEELGDSPELVNKDPYGRGWLVKVEVNGSKESLLTAEDYVEFVKKLAK